MGLVRVVTRLDKIVDEVTIMDAEVDGVSDGSEKIPLDYIGFTLPVKWDCRYLLQEYMDLSVSLEEDQRITDYTEDDVEYCEAMKVVLNRAIPSIRNYVRTHPLSFMLDEDFPLPLAYARVERQAMLKMFSMAYKYDLKDAWRFLAQSAFGGIRVYNLDNSLSIEENRAYYIQQVAGLHHEKYDVDGDERADLIGSILKNPYITDMDLADITVLAMSLASMSVAAVI